MKNLYLLAILTLSITIGCSSIQVLSDYDKSVDFTQYKTFEYYGWDDDSDKILNRFDKERIEEAFANEFDKRNLNLVKSDGDLVVSLFIVVEQKTKTTASTDSYGGLGGYGDYYGYGPGWGYGSGYRTGHSTTTYNEYNYEVGTLLISIYDKKTQQLIWEGLGKQTVDDNPDTRERKIPKAAQAIMNSFPIAIIQ